MSAAFSAQGELASPSDLAKVDTVISSIPTQKLELDNTAVKGVHTTKLKVYRPVSGLVGHCFIRACLLFDLATSWKRRAYVVLEGGFPTFATPDPVPRLQPSPSPSEVPQSPGSRVA